MTTSASGKKFRVMAFSDTPLRAPARILIGTAARFAPAGRLRHGLCCCAAAAAFAAASATAAAAQSPVLVPRTITSVAGSVPTTTTTLAACPTNPQFTATDATGNGCPAVNAVIPTVITGIAVDPLGNVYVSANSTNPQIVRKIDARSGIISAFAGNATGQCASGSGTKIYGTKASQTDKTGDNCPVTYSYGFNGPVDLGTDPYGNLLIASTGDYVLHLVCNSVSPACSTTQAAENLMIGVVGCTTSATSYGTAVAGTTAGTAGDGTAATQFVVSSCTTGVGGKIYGVTADKWDNIYFMDGSNGRIRVVAGAASITVNGSSVANPLFATLQTDAYSSPQQGYVYPIAGGASGGAACAGKTDTGGDGCPFYQTLVSTSSSGSLVQGLTVDPDGDLIFVDGLGDLRTIYMGGTLIKGALAANGITAPQLGYSYRMMGGGTSLYYNSADPGIVLGSASGLQSSAIQTLASDPAGNVIIGDQLQVLFYDLATGYVRRLATANGATSCNSSAVGDGCPLAQSLFGAANKALPIADDALGNLYLLDINDKLVRRVSTLSLPTTVVDNAVNTSSLSSSVEVHAPAGSASVSINAGPSTDFTVGSTMCTTNSSSDGTVDCTAPVTFAPSTLALRTSPLTVTTSNGTTTTLNLGLNGQSTGSALVFDTVSAPLTTTLAPATTGNTAIALDGAGNAYLNGAQGISVVRGSSVTNITSTPAAFMAVGADGSVYAANASATALTKYTYSAVTASYTASTVSLPSLDICTTSASTISCALTQAYTGPMVVDPYGFLYVADTTNKYVEKFSLSTGVGQQLTQTPLNSPTAMGEDSYGNLLVIDGTSILKVPAAGLAVTISSPVATPTVTLTTALTAPTSVTADQGGNVYIADNGAIKVQPFSGSLYTLPGVSGTSVAVDGAGNVYTVATAAAGITEDLRGSESFNFGTSITASFQGAIGNAGVTPATGFAQTDTAGNFTAATPATVLSASATTCNLASGTLAAGAVCNVSFSFTPTANGNGVVQDNITLLPSASTLGSISLSGTKSGTNATTSTVITGNTAGLIYTTGAETTFTVTVTESPAAVPSGTVAVTIDGGTAVNYNLTGATSSSATATVNISALPAGSHSIIAAYANSSGIVGSTSATTTFTIGQASTSVSWTPSLTSEPYSAAIGAAVLNATATSTAASGNIPGSFIYTATPAGGTAQPIHAASYLPTGSYALAVTFVPTDSVDFGQSTGSVSSFSVVQATTTAGIGATQMLVAADGTGNYSTVQAAVNALPSGGSVYIRPGTYPGFISVVQPNVALRGLGGDPTKVILTHEAGAFGSTYPYTGEFQATGINANNGGSNGYQMPSGSTIFTGDEGSATIVVAKGVNSTFGTSTLIPNNFYAENLSLINTYDTDTSTTTTTYAASNGGSCATNQGPAMTYSALYNAGTLCASQALAIWTTSDISVMNNVYTTSLQDTIYTASQGSGSNGYVPARQFWFRGKITGDVDYIFGDSAAVFDHTSVYTAWHGSTATGTETIHAQSKAIQTGSANDYLSGYVMNSDVFTSQSPGMTNLYFGRPYGVYSTWVMLNDYVDQVNALGYTTGLGPTLPPSTFVEYNDIPYTDPATNAADLNGTLYLGSGGNTGSGVTGAREASSTNPGTPMASNPIPTSMTQAQAQAYFPNAFLGQTVSSLVSTTQNWVPTDAIAAQANAFVPTGNSATVAGGSSVTILMRPKTPGLGAITNGVSTIPTGTYTLTDSFNSGTPTVIASGSLDPSGEASFTSSSLTAGTHTLSWTYGGDSNFAGSTAATYTLTITGTSSTTTTAFTAAPAPITYGQAAAVSVTVSSGGGTPAGTVALTLNGTTTVDASLSGGVASFNLTGLTAGIYSLSASFLGSSSYAPSSASASSSLTVNQFPLTINGSCSTRIFNQPNSCSASVTGPYQYNDSASTVFASAPVPSTTATRASVAGMYGVTTAFTPTAFGSTNYSFTQVNGGFTVTGGAPQSIVFPPLPNFTAGSYQLTARTTSGLPVTYSVTVGNGYASISGNTLTITGTGPVTIQAASATDPTGDYAAASPVSRSFTAQ
jgi:pectin methylesterase-like acyl-CoA thioesterase